MDTLRAEFPRNPNRKKIRRIIMDEKDELNFHNKLGNDLLDSNSEFLIMDEFITIEGHAQRIQSFSKF